MSLVTRMCKHTAGSVKVPKSHTRTRVYITQERLYMFSAVCLYIYLLPCPSPPQSLDNLLTVTSTSSFLSPSQTTMVIP